MGQIGLFPSGNKPREAADYPSLGGPDLSDVLMWLRVTAQGNTPRAGHACGLSPEGKVMGRTPLCPLPSVVLGPAALPQGFTAAELSLADQNPVKLQQPPGK